MSFSEHLKGQVDIVDVVAQYGVRLKRSGASGDYTGLCPFHQEKSPSFWVHSIQQYFKCFGCDAKGDVFRFVMDMDSLTFPEALKSLAERYGIQIPEWHRNDDPVTQSREALFEMHEIAADTFQRNLRGPQGASARAYLAQRGVSEESMSEFRLGLSDAGGQQLSAKLQKFPAALQESSGLVARSQSGSGYYDFFRARLMFPIHNESGKVIAFGGRALKPEEKVKYVNSKENPIYQKSEILYNLHRAKIAARKNRRLILVEGYLDAIGVHSSGTTEVAGICGTALSEKQVRTIRKQISFASSQTDSASASIPGEAILNLDPDAAGERGTEKHIRTLLSEGLRVKIVTLPDGLDPDEYIRKNGARAYEEQLNRAPTYFQWLADRARAKFDMRSSTGRVDAFQFIWPSVLLIQDRVERSIIANEMADYLGVDREVIRERFRKDRDGRTSTRKPEKLSSAVPPNEKLLLHCLLTGAEARAAIIHYLANTDILELLHLKPVFAAAVQLHAENGVFSLEVFASRLDERLQAILMEVCFSEAGVNQEMATQQALQCLAALERQSLEAKRMKLKQQVRELEQQGNFAEALELARQLNQINTQHRQS